MRNRTGRWATIILTTATLMGLAAAPASAGLLVEDAPNCSNGPSSQPFKPWNDSAYYTPLGSFENGAGGWKLSSKATVVAGNEPWKVGGANHSKSLKLAPGATATSPTACVGLEHPKMRFFAKSSGGLLSLSSLTVEVLVETELGLVVPVPIGAVLPHTSWKPSLRYRVVANLLPLLPNNYTPVAFRFRAIGGATWTIDDVYLDPRKRS